MLLRVLVITRQCSVVWFRLLPVVPEQPQPPCLEASRDSIDVQSLACALALEFPHCHLFHPTNQVASLAKLGNSQRSDSGKPDGRVTEDGGDTCVACGEGI